MIDSFQDAAEPLLQLDEFTSSLQRAFDLTRDLGRSGAFTLAIRGGRSGSTTFSDTPITLTAASSSTATVTTYVEGVTGSSTIVSNTSGYTAGNVPIGIATTNDQGLTNWQQDFVPAPAVATGGGGGGGGGGTGAPSLTQWGVFDGRSGSVSRTAGNGAHTITRLGTGHYTITWATAFSGAVYPVMITVADDNTQATVAYQAGATGGGRTTTSYTFYVLGLGAGGTTAPVDCSDITVWASL